MSERPATPGKSADLEVEARDERLSTLLAELTARLHQGEEPDLEAAAAQHPDLAADLRELWPAVLVAEQVARPVAGPSRPGAAPGTTSVGAPPPAGEDGDRAPPAIEGYEVLEELGRGGMGVVYRAKQVDLGRTVALKVILASELCSAASMARFRREAESAARLEHPHIVPVYEVGTSAGRPYFTMRLVEGETLARRLQRGPIAAREAAALLAPIARAIHHAHCQGVLHRDLKPSNILIDREGVPQVADFGLARRIEDVEGLTMSGAILGTPGYLAPEQAAGSRGRTGPLSDVYSLGAILYHCLTGRPPFQAVSPVEAVLLVLEEEPPPPRLVNPRVDRDLEAVALRCLEKPPDLRYPSAEALAADLEAYLAGEPLSTGSSGLGLLLSRMLRETHHAAILRNWGLLWMWHSLAVLLLSLSTNVLQWRGVASPVPYVLIWTAGLGTWAAVFWALRRRAGPITFVERQVAHLWAGGVLGSAALFLVEMELGLHVLTLSPVLALLSGVVFLAKAGILSGRFYFQALAQFLTAAAMARFPDVGLTIFGFTNAVSFFLPGWKYYQEARADPPPRR